MPTYDDEMSYTRVLPQTRKQSRGALKAMLSKRPGRAPRREAAIRRRLRPQDDRGDQATSTLLNVLENLRSGKLPNNKQISDALLSFRDSPTMDGQTSRLTPASQKLWNDIKELLTTWDKVIKSKNSNSELQNFMYHSRLAAESAQSRMGDPRQMMGQVQDQPDVLQSSKDTAVLLATSGEFRDLMTNLSFVVRDMFGSYGKIGEFGPVERLIKEGKPLSPEEEEEAGMARESRRGEDEAGMGRERRLGEEETLKNEKKPFVDYREGTFSEGQRVSNGRGDEEPGMDRERRRDEGQPLKTEKKPFVGYREGTFYEGQEASTGRGEEGYGEEGGEYGREGRREPSIKKKPFVGYREGTFYQGEPATEKSQEKGREEEMTGRGQTGRRDQEAPDVGYRGSHFYPGKVSSHEMPQRKQQIGRDEEGWREWQETETQGAEESQRRMPREQDLGSRRAGESRQEQARALGEIAKTGRHLREEQQVPEEQEEFAMPPERFEGEEAAGAWEPSRYQKVTEYQRHPEKDTDQVGRRGGQEARGLKEEHATKAQWPYIPAEGHEEGPESIRRSVFGGMPEGQSSEEKSRGKTEKQAKVHSAIDPSGRPELVDVTIPPELRGEEAPQRFRGAGPVPGNLGVAAESVQPAASSVKQAVQEGVKSAADVLSGKSHNPESYHEGYDSGMKAHREHVPGAQGDDQRLYFDPAGADTREIVTGHSECPNVSESAQESARDTAKNVRESFVGDAPDRLRGGAEPPGDSSQGWMAKAQEAVSFGMHKVQDTLTATKDTVSEYAQSATNTAKDTAVKGNENIYSVAGMGKENVQSAAQSGKENIKAAAQQGKESYASAADTGSAAFQSATGTVKENVQYATEMGKENIESASAKTKGAAAKGNEALQSAGAMGRENIQSAASKGKDGLQATKDRAQQLGQDAQKQKDTTLGESPERLRGGAEPPGDTHSWTAKAHETLSSGIQKMQDTLTLSKKSGQAESAAAKGKENVQSSADKGKGSFLSSKDRSQSLKEEMRGQAPEVTQRSKEDLNLSGPAMTPSGHQLKEKSQDLQEAVKADMGANLTSGSESATKGNRVVEETVPHRLRGAGEPGKEGVGNLLSSAKEKISSGSEKVKQSTQGAQDTKGKAEEAYQKGQETVSQTRDQQQSASGGPQRMRGGSPTSSGHGESWTGALKSKISHGVEAVTGAFTGPSPGSQSNAPADIKAIPTAELRMPEENSGTLSEDMSTKAHHWASDAKDAIAEEANKSRKILIAAEKRRKTDTVDPSLMEYHENVLSGVPGVDDEPYMPSEVRETIGLGLDEGIEAYPGPMRLSEEQKLHPEHDWTKATRDSLSHAMEKVRETFKLHPDERKSKGASVDIGKHASTVDFYSGKGDSPSERATPQRLRGAATGAQMMEDRGTQWQERGKAEGKGLAGKARESMSGSKSKRGQDVTKDVGDRPGREQSAQGRGSKEGGESGLRGHQRTGQQERDGSGQERGMLEGKQEMTQQRRSVQGKEQRGMSERISGGRGEEGRTEKGRDTAESYELSDEERRILVERFQEIVTGIKKDPEYLKVFRFMIDSLRQVESEIRKRAIAKAEYPDRIENEWAGDANLVRAQLELRRVVERFANGHKTQPLIDSLNMIKERMEQDYRLREIIEDSLTYCERCLEDEDFRRDPDSMERGVELVRRSRSYIFKRHREDVEHIFRETSSFLNDLQRDPLTQELSEDMTKVTEQLFVKEGGQVKPNPSLLRDALVVLLPIIVDQTRVIPIPQIEHSDPKIHYIVGQFDLPVDDILPSFIEVNLKRSIVLGLRDEIQDEYLETAKIVLHEVQMDISDIPFSYKRKMGFPRLTDYGVLDIKTLGQGISTQIKMDYFPNDPNKTFVARDVSTFVDNVRFRIHGSQHDRLYRFFRSTMSNVIRGRIAESVEKTVKDWVQRIDAFVTPRKVQYGAPKPSGLSQFESLLGAAGVVSKEAGMQGAAQQGVPSPTDKTKARQEREYKSKLKSRIQTPWESQAFEIRPASAL